MERSKGARRRKLDTAKTDLKPPLAVLRRAGCPSSEYRKMESEGPAEKYRAANAAVKRKESIFEIVYRRLVPRLGHNKTIGAIAHRLCQLIWMILYKGVRYEERGPAVCEQSKRVRTVRMIRTLRKLGHRYRDLGAWNNRVAGIFHESDDTSRVFLPQSNLSQTEGDGPDSDESRLSQNPDLPQGPGRQSLLNIAPHDEAPKFQPMAFEAAGEERDSKRLAS